MVQIGTSVPLLGDAQLPEAKPAARPNAAFAAELGSRLGPDRATSVRAVRTALSPAEAASHLRSAWQTVFGEAPSEETVSILTAQWAHETGHGASMYNYNFGGIKGTGPSGLTVAQRTREGWGETETTIVDRFRAYRSAEEGAVDYVRFLSGRYKGALEGAKQGDAGLFVSQLKARGYFTGNEAAYTRSVSSFSQSALANGYDAMSRGAPAAALPSERALLDAVPPREFEGFTPATSAPIQSSTTYYEALAAADEITRAALRLSLDEAREHSRKRTG